MIHSPWAVIAALLGIETAVLWLSSQERFKSWFKFIPSIFWIYFLPMLASTLGILDPQSPIYSKISNQLLPMSLFLLLLTVDVRAILRLGKTALLMFFAGAAGVGLGIFFVFWLFKPWIGGQFWSGFGALAGSWTGGSANMIAVKEALGTPDAVFLPMVVVDTIVPYFWMGLLVIAAAHQQRYDRFNRSDRRILDELSHKLGTAPYFSEQASKKIGRCPQFMQLLSSIGILVLAIAGGLAAKYISQFLPVIKDVISTYAWTIIVVSSLAIACSFTPLKRIEAYGSSKIGYFILYFVLTSIGAKANISNIGNALILIGAGFLIVLIHAAVLLITARVIRAPLFLAAVASQANVGGVASAPMVAEIYQKGFASVGLLLAILGNIIGTYIGIAVGQLCRLLQ